MYENNNETSYTEYEPKKNNKGTAIKIFTIGLIISLIPNMVKDYNNKDNESMNQTFNKCLKIILFFSFYPLILICTFFPLN